MGEPLLGSGSRELGIKDLVPGTQGTVLEISMRRINLIVDWDEAPTMVNSVADVVPVESR